MSHISITESAISQEITTQNTRYDTLFKNLGGRLDDLELMRRLMALNDDGNKLVNWEMTTDSRLEREVPTSNDIDTLKKEIKNYQVNEGFVPDLKWREF